ncbi:hypothetical protein [Paremcibacter congregatus]|uniref:hypothetical protein n=1 Tax=Paremcibacter congregatus TaxID=2043170 RepID=UPI0030EB13E6
MLKPSHYHLGRHKGPTGHRAVKVFLMAATALGLWTAPGQAAVDILDVRTGLHPDKTRVVLELSDATFYEVSYRQDPALEGRREIVVDLKEAPSREAVSALTKDMQVVGLVQDVIVEDHLGGVRLRIALRTSAVVDKSFLLKPDHGMQYRLVFDLKAISGAEWSRLVKRTVPDTAAVELKEPAEPEQPAPAEEPVAPASSRTEDEIPVTPAPPVSVPDVTPERAPETYDEAVSGDERMTLSGYIEMEGRFFPQSSFYPAVDDWTVSFALEPLMEYISDSGGAQFSFRPFGRLDVQDSARSHFDIRALKWTGTVDRLQATVGIDTVFWGVTESVHLVNILNQDDLLEDIDQEDKLGQPMATVSYTSDFGVFSAYLMTYFREQRFPGAEGRLRLPLAVDYSQTDYQAGAGKWHADWAVRWSHVIENFDIGLYHFRGTNRDVDLALGTDADGAPVLVPRYNLINQTGLDLQATFNDLLIKFEGIRRTGVGAWAYQDYWALAGGFEYTFYDLLGGGADISLLSEYLYDDRGDLATSGLEDDLFVGVRWAANDIDSTQILMGTIFDLNSRAKFVNLEGSRRIGDSWKISLDARLFLGVPVGDPFYSISRDDFIQLRLARYF